MQKALGVLTYELHSRSFKPCKLAAFEIDCEEVDFKSFLSKVTVLFTSHQLHFNLLINYTSYSRLPTRSAKLTVEDVMQKLGNTTVKAQRKKFFEEALEEFELTAEAAAREKGMTRPLYTRLLDPCNSGKLFSLAEQRQAQEFKESIDSVEACLQQLIPGAFTRIRE